MSAFNSVDVVVLSLRERYLITQALVLGIEELAEVEGPMREWSNIQGMGDLLKIPSLAPFTMAVLECQRAIGKPATTAATIVHEEEEEEEEDSR